MKIKTLLFLAAFLCLSIASFGQAARYDSQAWTTGTILANTGVVKTVPSASITVCTYPAATFGACTKVPLCTDSTMSSCSTGSNPVTADSSGNFGFWVAPGKYDYWITAFAANTGPYHIVAAPDVSSLNGVVTVDGVTYAQTSAGIQAAVTAASGTTGGAVFLPCGTYTITASTTITTNVDVIGAGWCAVLNLTAAMTQVFLVQPTGASTISGQRFQNFQIQKSGSGSATQAIHYDGTNGEIYQPRVIHLNVQDLGSGLAIKADGSGNTQGTPVLADIYDNEFHGGISFSNSGDTNRIANNRITGAGKCIDASFQAGASAFILTGNNLTCDGGSHLGTSAIAPVIVNNEFETFGTFTGSNGAVLDLDGATGQTVTDAVITGNTFQVVNGITANCLRLNWTNRAYVAENRFGRGATTSIDLVVTANGNNNYIGQNQWVAGSPWAQMISDSGTLTNFGPLLNPINGLLQLGPIFTVSDAAGNAGFTCTSAVCKGKSAFSYGWTSTTDSNSGTFQTQISQLGAGQISIDGTTRNGSAGSVVQTGGVDLGTSQIRGALSITSAARILLSATAPTISSGFGTSPSIANNNGTAAFVINVGTGGSATNGVIGMPTAATGWNCSPNNITAAAGHRADNTRQTASSTTTVTIENQTTSTGAALAWTASDIVRMQCAAY